jgi:hypothetical protein
MKLSTIDKFDGTTKRDDLNGVIGEWLHREYSTGRKLISVSDTWCTLERKDGTRFRQPSYITWNSFFF